MEEYKPPPCFPLYVSGDFSRDGKSEIQYVDSFEYASEVIFVDRKIRVLQKGSSEVSNTPTT